jgi:hypothetical protein
MKTISSLIGWVAMVGMAVLVSGQDISKIQKSPPVWLNELQMHTDYTRRFIESPGFGVSRIRPSFESITDLRIEGATYQVVRVGLIGIAERARPVAYVTPHGMADLTNAVVRADIERRELTAFETNALPQLARGRDIVSDLKAGLVVGALRARQDCLKCHEGKVGTLLGAISYVMTPVAPPPSQNQKLLLSAVTRAGR